MSDQAEQLSFSIIHTKMTVAAMRDSGYKSTTHALAELIDNAIEAGAQNIEIFGVSRIDDRTGRATLNELAVLDNGSGMDPITLRGSLCYGYGTRTARKGIGRYGVGLPNSSMSQAKCVDVWSWRNGVPNAMHTRLRIQDIEAGVEEMPAATLRKIPSVYLKASLHGFEDTGTLVVWSDLDRVEWKRASTTFRHTEALLGRIYRRFLAGKTDRLHTNDNRSEEVAPQRTIMCIPVDLTGDHPIIEQQDIVRVRPNDPLYLMANTSCPEAFGPGPMFQELDSSPFPVDVTYHGTTHRVWVRGSYARPHVRNSSHDDADWPSQWLGRDAGNAPWGKHADHNSGVSVVRSHREIDLDTSWLNEDTTERWWTVEVDFPPALDELFGVTNNKQGTMTFQRLGKYDWRREALPGEDSPGDVRRRMEDDGDPRAYLLELHRQVMRVIASLRNHAKESNQPRKTRHQMDEQQKADAKVSAAIKRRGESGHKGESDAQPPYATETDRLEEEARLLTDKHHLEQQDARAKVRETLERGHRVRWIETSQASPAFFDVEPQPQVLQVVFNKTHPVHDYFYHLLTDDLSVISEDEAKERLAKASSAFKILIYSWARFEEEQTESDARRIRNSRIEWGKYAEEFFDETDDAIIPTDLV